MTYDYQCEKCGKTWEMFLPYTKRDEPLSEDHCEKGGCKVVRLISAPNMNYETSRGSVLNQAGSGWNDVLNDIKKNSGKDNTIITK
jgi:predicted nucleic acid-binding Zn ribbon protein